MVKEFQIVLTPPSQGASTSDDIVITGHLLLVTEKTKKGYLFIAVALEGYAKIGLRSDRGQYETTATDQTIETKHFREDYVYESVIVWKRENAPNHELSPGSYNFTFVLKLQTSGRPLPPSFEGRYGRIRYEVVATIVQASMLKSWKRISEQVDTYCICSRSQVCSRCGGSESIASGEDIWLSVLGLRSNKSDGSCSKDWVLCQPGCHTIRSGYREW